MTDVGKQGLDFGGRRVLITGASSGIGRAAAIVLSSLGADIVLCGRDEKRLEETLDAMNDGQHIMAPFDLAEDLEGIPDWLKYITGEHGPLNGLVHCAGIESTIPVRQVDPESIENVLRINTKAALLLAKGVCSKKSFRLPCSIVFISSVMAIAGRPARSIYSASKGALNAMARSLAIELARKNIRVNTICPGQVQTEMDEAMRQRMGVKLYEQIVEAHPLGLGKPEDIASSIAFLLSDMSRWITGTSLVVDGGYTAI
ncbi:SDR family NAD(P)-dependent oxidoreductase [Desulfoplanes formicivorans]|uniref:Short-chain dehydrogenase n=1 Tax=Desulfoplanes formicivorans TaxID=1592317 RepID=A0A194AH14_9BACT|nr:SDR family oxidoreductase [Desulfoplanes formicivorans]GAU09372.1 short-chain dehydrogenase [Desulfoplanes formicivorans]